MTDRAAAVAARIEAAFERVLRDRMAGLPFVNAALRIELVGPRRWHGLWLGVLVTPWFMNLMLLPDDGADEPGEPDEVKAQWPRPANGEYAKFVFPAGVMSFLAGREGGAGEYLSCSLFSPVFDFADHAAARQMAEACLLALLDPEAAQAAAAEAAPAPPGRRDFVLGRWHGDAATSPSAEGR